MSKKLLIVESPAKAKTIGKYLGDDFVVKSSVGHIRDLPKKGLSIKIAPDAAQVAELRSFWDWPNRVARFRDWLGTVGGRAP